MQVPGAVINNGADPREMRANFNGGRLDTVTTTALEFNRYTGEYVEVAEQLVPIPVTGIGLSNSDLTIDSIGESTGFGPIAGTLYYCYLSNAVVSEFPLSLRLSTVAPSDSATSGQRYLATSGNGANWRLVGYVYVDAGGLFQSDAARRYVVNESNRIPMRLSLTPAYNNNNAQTTVARTTANFAALNSGTGDVVGWCDNGRDIAVWLTACFSVLSTPASVTHWGLAVDSTTSASVAATIAASAANEAVSVSLFVPPASQALRTASMVCATGAGATWIADIGRMGSTADVAATFLEGWILA